MVPAPPEVSQRRGRSMARCCAAHIWCWPTSVDTMASRPASWARTARISCCGWMVVSPGVKARQSAARQRSMRDHQGASRVAGSAGGSNAVSASSTAPQSPASATSTAITLPILPGWISIWILRAPGAKSLSRPVMRSSKRAPTQMIRSAWCMARLASTVPCMPSMPRNSGSDAGSAPRPISVSVVGRCQSRASAAKRSQAPSPALISPPPP